VFDQFARYLLAKGFNIKQKKVDHFTFKYYCFFKKTIKFLNYFAIIQNENTGSFYVLECHDWENPFTAFEPSYFVTDRRCKVYLKCQYQQTLFNKYPLTKVKPWTYFEAKSPGIQPWLEELRKTKRTEKSLYFRGNTRYGRNEILDFLKKRGTINLDSEPVEFRQYLKEICAHKIILALPGMGNICHREIESFGAGTPVLMPLLKTTFFNALIPDHHYISVKIDTIKDDAKYMAVKLEERFQQVIDDSEYLDFVAKNAMKWYDENVRFPDSLELTAKILGFINR
jgi:hypothetical protein